MKAVLVLSAFAMVACGERDSANHIPHDEAVKLAREATQEAYVQLTGELAKAIHSGGPVAAMSICSEKALPLVAKVAAKRQIGMRRLSDHPRNPDQLAEGNDLATMEAFRASMRNGITIKPAVEEMPDGTTIVRLPIVANSPLCLQCHGTEADISAPTRNSIIELYPLDQATGYRLNYLRGIWQVTLRPEPAP